MVSIMVLCEACLCSGVPQGAPRLLFMRAFAHLFEGKPSGLNTLNILRNMVHLTSLRAAINQTIIDDFTAAREAVKVGAMLNSGDQYILQRLQQVSSSTVGGWLRRSALAGMACYV